MPSTSRTLARLALATAAYAAVHSLFAARPVKQAAARWFGVRDRNGLYRVFYLAQSAVTGGIFYLYVRQLPDKKIYEVRGPLRSLMQVGRFAGLGWAVWAAAEVGIPQILGIESLGKWLQDRQDVPAEPEAQGPSGSPRVLRTGGPFLWSRHPLNFAPIPVFWLRPRMTRNLLAFNLLATAYFYIGSLHEAERLRREYGEAYRRYENSGVSFLIPLPRSRSSQASKRLAS